MNPFLAFFASIGFVSTLAGLVFLFRYAYQQLEDEFLRSVSYDQLKSTGDNIRRVRP